MLVGEMKPEFVLVILDRLQRRELHIGMTGKAARIDAPCVVARLTLHDLLRQ